MIAVGVVWSLGFFDPEEKKAKNPPPAIASLAEGHIVVGKVGKKEWSEMTIYLNEHPQLFKDDPYKWHGNAPALGESIVIPLTDFLSGTKRFNPFAQVALAVWIGGHDYDYIRIPLGKNNEAMNLALALQAMDGKLSDEEQGNPVAEDSRRVVLDGPEVPVEGFDGPVKPEKFLIAEREWTDTKGRALMATLIDVEKLKGQYVCAFSKPNGERFTYELLKLSRGDRELIRETLIQEGRISE